MLGYNLAVGPVDAAGHLPGSRLSYGAAADQTPPGFSYSAAQACTGLSQAFTPESPGLQAFVAYGAAKAYTGTAETAAAGYVAPSVADPSASAVFSATSNAALLGYGTATAVASGAIGAGVAAASVVFGTKFSLLTASGVSAIAAASTAGATISVVTVAALGATVAAVVGAVVTAVIAGISVFREAAIPDQLQSLVNTAGNDDPLSCLSTNSGDQCGNAQKELFANFVLSTLPDYPGTDPAPAAQPGDPQLIVAGSPVDWVQYIAADGTQRSFRLSSGPWFVDRADSNGAGTLTLSIKYKDAAGATWAARRVGTQFLPVRTDVSPTSSGYPAPRQSASLTVKDWSGRTVTAGVDS